MKIEQERKLFYLIAAPMTNYFKEQGVDEIESLPMVTSVAQRIFDNLKNNISMREENEATEEV